MIFGIIAVIFKFIVRSIKEKKITNQHGHTTLNSTPVEQPVPQIEEKQVHYQQKYYKTTTQEDIHWSSTSSGSVSSNMSYEEMEDFKEDMKDFENEMSRKTKSRISLKNHMY